MEDTAVMLRASENAEMTTLIVSPGQLQTCGLISNTVMILTETMKVKKLLFIKGLTTLVPVSLSLTHTYTL